MKHKHITALIAISGLTLALSGCIGQSSPKLAYLQAVSNLDSANIYEKHSNSDLDIAIEGTLTNEKRTFINWMNQASFHSTSLHNKTAGVIDSSLTMESSIGALPTQLNLPLTVDESNQKVYIQLEGVSQALQEIIPVPEKLHEKTLALSLNPTDGHSTNNMKSFLYTELVNFAKSLPETSFTRIDRTEQEKQAKIKDKISLSLTDSDIKGLVQDTLSKADLPNESKNALHKLLNALKFDHFNLTVSIGKSGQLVADTSDIRIFQTAAPVPNTWSYRNESTYKQMVEATSVSPQPKTDSILSMTEMVDLILSVQQQSTTSSDSVPD